MGHGRRAAPPMAHLQTGADPGMDTSPYATTTAAAEKDDIASRTAAAFDPVSPLLPGQLDEDEDEDVRNKDGANHSGDAFRMNEALVHRPVSPIVLTQRASDGSDATVTPPTSNMGSPRANPRKVHPPPAYVAAFGAVQVANDDQAQFFASDDHKGDLRFTESALSLINNFLDHVLFSVLAQARSTSLTALRLAILHVLQARLGKAAIESANDELRELLSGNDEDEELNSEGEDSGDNPQWNLEMVWKRTRLRVMVYTRLGDMEDEDEQRFVKDEDLLQGSERRFSQATGLVSWAAAIYLTSVLEFVAEHVIRIGTQAAVARSRVHKAHSPSKADVVEVDSFDVEKIALNSVLGKIWRAWRRTLRKPQSIDDGVDETAIATSTAPLSSSNGEPRHTLDATSTANPSAYEKPSMHGNTANVLAFPTRSKSLHRVDYSHTFGGLLVPQVSDSPSFDERPILHRQRSSSLPSASRTPLSFDQIYRLPGAFPVDTDGSETPRPAETRNIEELDSRKALIDIKTLTRGKFEPVDQPSTGNTLPNTTVSSRDEETVQSLTVESSTPTAAQPLLETTENAIAAMPVETPLHGIAITTPSEPTTIDQAAQPSISSDIPAARSSVQSSRSLHETSVGTDDAVPATLHAPEIASSTKSDPDHSIVQPDNPRDNAPSTLPEVAPPADAVIDPETVALTSAAIRGPEDFESFGHVHDFDAADNDMGEAELDARPESRDEQKPNAYELDGRAGRTTTARSATSAAYAEDAGSPRAPRRSRSVPRPPSRNLSAHRRSGLLAREPRVQTESTRDFADFIRSTGPNKRQDAGPVLLTTSQSMASLREMRKAHANDVRSSSLDRSKIGSRGTTHTVDGSVPPVPRVPTTPSRVRTTMEPRSPVATTEGHSELIDFIRSGPIQNGQHRISRTVAPFRSTMDSDELQDYGNTINRMRSMTSGTSEKRRSVSLPNVFDVSNLNREVAHPAHDGSAPRLSGYAVAVDGPVRRQIRNKDPYAKYYMDDDDDDYDDLTDTYTGRLTALPPSQPKEESLAEFLRNSSPPRTRDTARGGIAPTTPIGRPSTGPGTSKQGSPGIARSARSTTATRAETKELIRFLNEGPPSESAPSPTIGHDRWTNPPKTAASVRTERSVRNSVRRSALFSWIK